MDHDTLASWRDTPTRQAILDFVAAVTDPDGSEFVPEVDRVAVFDNDGTLTTEMPLYTQLAFALDRAGELGKPMTLEELQAGGLAAVFPLLGLTHGGMTSDEFDEIVRAWAATATDSATGRLYTATVYQPMLELVELLTANRFSCWIFSGGGTDFMRAWAPEVFGLAPHRMIGSTGAVEFQLGDDGPQLVRGTDLAVLDDGAQKPIAIHQHVGQRPILAAGNTNGDLPMLQWTAASPYRSLQLVVHHDDAEREVAYDHDPLLGSGQDQVFAAAAAHGWSVIDMSADWANVYAADT